MLHKEQRCVAHLSQVMLQIQDKFQIPIKIYQKEVTEILISGTLDEVLGIEIFSIVANYIFLNPKLHLEVRSSAFILFLCLYVFNYVY